VPKEELLPVAVSTTGFDGVRVSGLIDWLATNMLTPLSRPPTLNDDHYALYKEAYFRDGQVVGRVSFAPEIELVGRKERLAARALVEKMADGMSAISTPFTTQHIAQDMDAIDVGAALLFRSSELEQRVAAAHAALMETNMTESLRGEFSQSRAAVMRSLRLMAPTPAVVSASGARPLTPLIPLSTTVPVAEHVAVDIGAGVGLTFEERIQSQEQAPSVEEASDSESEDEAWVGDFINRRVPEVISVEHRRPRGGVSPPPEFTIGFEPPAPPLNAQVFTPVIPPVPITAATFAPPLVMFDSRVMVFRGRRAGSGRGKQPRVPILDPPL
jgi:hypothetical protein